MKKSCNLNLAAAQLKLGNAVEARKAADKVRVFCLHLWACLLGSSAAVPLCKLGNAGEARKAAHKVRVVNWCPR